MTQVTVNGNTYSDDGTAARDMTNGGHRNWFLALLQDAVSDLAAKVLAATSAATTAVNAPGTSATSTTLDTVALGSTTIMIQAGKSLVAGMWVMISSTASPTNQMFGPITAYNSGTGQLTVSVVGIAGAGTFSAWTVALSAPGGAPLASPAFTGTPTAPTAAAGTNTTQLATCAFATTAATAARDPLPVFLSGAI